MRRNDWLTSMLLLTMASAAVAQEQGPDEPRKRATRDDRAEETRRLEPLGRIDNRLRTRLETRITTRVEPNVEPTDTLEGLENTASGLTKAQAGTQAKPAKRKP